MAASSKRRQLTIDEFTTSDLTFPCEPDVNAKLSHEGVRDSANDLSARPGDTREAASVDDGKGEDATTGFREVLARCLNVLAMCEEQAVGSNMVDKATIVRDVKRARDYINRVWKVYAF